jgi:putative ABC transport system permease protein
VAIVTLALGLGVNAAMFSLTREVLLRPLPYRDADRLVWIYERSLAAGIEGSPVTPINYVGWRDRVDALEQTAAFRRVSFNLSTNSTAEQVEGFQIAPDFLPMLGVQPAIGRGFAQGEAEPGRDGVVLLTDGLWRREFDADPNILGRSIDVDGTPCIVVGVLARSFTIYHVLNREIELFRPLVLDPSDREHSINLYARLKPAASIERGRAELAAAYASLQMPGQSWTAGMRALTTTFAANARPTLIALEWAVAFVLLIACANIANLLLAVSAGRRKELAIRHALGATRWRIARDLAGETLLLTIAGAAVAALLTTWIVAVLNAAVSFQDINRLHPFRVDGWVLAFTAAVAVAIALVFGVLPARAAASVDVVDTLKDSSHGVTSGPANRRLRQILIVGELALSIVLAASALALTRSVVALHGLERGLTREGIMTAQVSLSGPRYADTGRLVDTASSMLERLASTPGIDRAALVNYPPLSLIRVSVPVSIEGHPSPTEAPFAARYWVVTPDYFRALGIPMLAGRDFTASDDASAPGVAIVSATFARRFWNSTDVGGRRFETLFPESGAFWIPRARRGPLTIVGVVGDVREDGLRDAAGLPQLYLPYRQNPTTAITLVAHPKVGPSEAAGPAIREAVRTLDPQAPVSYARSMNAVIGETFARPREMAWLVGAFASLALALSAIGVYGVMAYLTMARAREIGIRIALGARIADIVRLMVDHAVKLTAAGVAIGLILSPMALRLLSGVLFGIGPFDPMTLAAVLLLMWGVSIAATIIPAVRAARLASLSFR